MKALKEKRARSRALKVSSKSLPQQSLTVLEKKVKTEIEKVVQLRFQQSLSNKVYSFPRTCAVQDDQYPHPEVYCIRKPTIDIPEKTYRWMSKKTRVLSQLSLREDADRVSQLGKQSVRDRVSTKGNESMRERLRRGREKDRYDPASCRAAGGREKEGYLRINLEMREGRGVGVGLQIKRLEGREKRFRLRKACNFSTIDH